jgi:hypothetical protein
MRVVHYQRTSGVGPNQLFRASRTVIASTASTSVDFSVGDAVGMVRLALQANTSLSFTNLPDTSARTFAFTLATTNDATAGRALSWGNTIKWSGAVVPNRTTAANAVDIYTFTVDNGVIYGELTIPNAA